jgi:hypothetical protein
MTNDKTNQCLRNPGGVARIGAFFSGWRNAANELAGELAKIFFVLCRSRNGNAQHAFWDEVANGTIASARDLCQTL